MKILKIKELHRYLGFYGRMRIVILQFKIFKRKIKNIFDFWVQFHLWKGSGIPGKLQCYLLHMVAVNMNIPKSVYEISRLVTANLSHHHGKQGIRGDIEGYS